MRELMKDAGLKEPQFQYDEFFEASFLRPSYYDKNYGTYDLSKKDNNIERQLNATQLKMIELIKANPRITQENMAIEVGLSRVHQYRFLLSPCYRYSLLDKQPCPKSIII